MRYFYSLPTDIINNSFQTGNFPNELNLTEVMSGYKKKDPLNKEIYRPVSFLSYVGKNFEKSFYEQINSYMEPRFSHLLCGFRKKIMIPNTLF